MHNYTAKHTDQQRAYIPQKESHQMVAFVFVFFFRNDTLPQFLPLDRT